MREGDFYGAKKTLLASGGKSCVQYTGNGCVYYPGRKSNRISHAVRCGWIISAIATPLVNWLEKRLKIVKKLGTAMIVIMVYADRFSGIFCSQQDCSGSDRSDSELSGYLCTAGRGDARDRKYLIRCV